MYGLFKVAPKVSGLLNGHVPGVMAERKKHPDKIVAVQRKPGFFGRGGRFWDLLGIAGDAATGEPLYARSLLNRAGRRTD